jgi:hypothetical protein
MNLLRSAWRSHSLHAVLMAIALACIALVWWQRSQAFEQQRAAHAATAQRYADIAWGMQRFGGLTEEASNEARPLWAQHFYHAELAAKYHRAAWLGFVAVPREEEPPPGLQISTWQ